MVPWIVVFVAVLVFVAVGRAFASQARMRRRILDRLPPGLIDPRPDSPPGVGAAGVGRKCPSCGGTASRGDPKCPYCGSSFA